jgi:hypothetical protein
MIMETQTDSGLFNGRRPEVPILTSWVAAAAQQLADATGQPVSDVNGDVHSPVSQHERLLAAGFPCA